MQSKAKSKEKVNKEKKQRKMNSMATKPRQIEQKQSVPITMGIIHQYNSGNKKPQKIGITAQQPNYAWNMGRDG